MTAEQWPTSGSATAALKAAAVKAYEASVRGQARDAALITNVPYEEPEIPPYDGLPERVRRSLEEELLPIVWAALAALPDPRYAAWEAGYIAADNGRDESINPYPSGA